MRFSRKNELRERQKHTNATKVNMVKAAFKVLPFLIGFALLLGISNTSATTSYIGVTVGSTYDYLYSVTSRNATASETYSGTYRVIVQNITDGNPCGVGLLWEVTSGNLSSMPSLMGITSSSIGMNVTVIDSTSVVFPGYVISTNVSNKSYHTQMLNYLPYFTYLDMKMTWDGKGMIASMTEDINYISGQKMSLSLSPVNSTPGYDVPVMVLAMSIAMAGVIGLLLKKRH
jgi:hypothetical protein